MSTSGENLADLIKYCGVSTGELADAEKREFDEECSQEDFMENCLINDAIYGPVEINRLLYLILNTPEFNRLRHIKQLGAANYVYPGANHTRLDHSIGVCHLAGEFAKSLKEKLAEDSKTATQDDLEKELWTFENKEIICVQIAGLCHDLGHGPFSHMFEMVMKKVCEGETEFHHEDLSVAIFKRLLVKNPKVLARFTKANLGLKEVKLIEKMIQPPTVKFISDSQTKTLDRDEQRAFLYEIVANKETGIDVDKWDYYARDCHYLGVTNDFQYKRCMKLGRVVKAKDGRLRIAFRDKEMDSLYGMFRTRGSLHQKAYQHKTSKAVEQMISDAMILAAVDPKFDLIGVSNSDKPLTIQDAVQNAAKYINSNQEHVSVELLEGYLALTDCILSAIKGRAFVIKSTKVTKLIERIEKRDLYHLSARVRIAKEDVNLSSSQGSADNTWETLEKLRSNEAKGLNTQIIELLVDKEIKIQSSDMWIHIVRHKLASEKKDNPVNDVLFYKKPKNRSEPIQVLASNHELNELTSMLARPKALVEYEVRIYDKREASVRKLDKGSEEALQNALDTWKMSLVNK